MGIFQSPMFQFDFNLGRNDAIIERSLIYLCSVCSYTCSLSVLYPNMMVNNSKLPSYLDTGMISRTKKNSVGDLIASRKLINFFLMSHTVLILSLSN